MSFSNVFETGFGTIVGWGVADDGRSATILRKGKVPLLPELVCSLSFTDFRILSNICAGGTTQDTCFGDSGGPLLCDGDPPVLCGVSRDRERGNIQKI